MLKIYIEKYSSKKSILLPSLGSHKRWKEGTGIRKDQRGEREIAFACVVNSRERKQERAADTAWGKLRGQKIFYRGVTKALIDSRLS